MAFFSIPDIVELKEPRTSTTFIAYNIHINGAFHCTLRYKQLYSFHEQLKKGFGQVSLPFFPPKRILPLSQEGVEERRLQLEKYIQIVSQEERIVNSDIFDGFLLNAQLESLGKTNESVNLDIYRMNWEPINVEVMNSDRTWKVLVTVAKQLGLSDHFSSHFSLYLAQRENIRSSLIRRLQNFESPVLSLKIANDKGQENNHFVVIRRSYWDNDYDQELYKDNVGLEILYNQIVSDVEQGWIQAPKKIARQLVTLAARRAMKEYIDIAKTLKYYGYVQFNPCYCDYPKENSQVIISAGGKELSLRTHSNKDEEETEYSFQVTRIRCWRLTINPEDNNGATASENTSAKSKFLFSFEYLLNKDILKWVTIASNQAVLISICLKGMVNELLMKRKGLKLPEEISDRVEKRRSNNRRDSWSYMKRDGSSHQMSLPHSITLDSFSNGNQESHSIKLKNQRPMNGQGSKKNESKTENSAFDGIGDDDL